MSITTNIRWTLIEWINLNQWRDFSDVWAGCVFNTLWFTDDFSDLNITPDITGNLILSSWASFVRYVKNNDQAFIKCQLTQNYNQPFLVADGNYYVFLLIDSSIITLWSTTPDGSDVFSIERDTALPWSWFYYPLFKINKTGSNITIVEDMREKRRLDVEEIIVEDLTVNGDTNLDWDVFIWGNNIDNYIENVVNSNPAIGRTEYWVTATWVSYWLIEDKNPSQFLYQDPTSFNGRGCVNLAGLYVYTCDDWGNIYRVLKSTGKIVATLVFPYVWGWAIWAFTGNWTRLFMIGRAPAGASQWRIHEIDTTTFTLNSQLDIWSWSNLFNFQGQAHYSVNANALFVTKISWASPFEKYNISPVSFNSSVNLGGLPSYGYIRATTTHVYLMRLWDPLTVTKYDFNLWSIAWIAFWSWVGTWGWLVVDETRDRWYTIATWATTSWIEFVLSTMTSLWWQDWLLWNNSKKAQTWDLLDRVVIISWTAVTFWNKDKRRPEYILSVWAVTDIMTFT